MEGVLTVGFESEIVGISRRRERLERQGVAFDSVCAVYEQQFDKVVLSDSATADLAYSYRSYRFDSAYIPYGADSSTWMLLHMNDAVASSFADSSENNHTFYTEYASSSDVSLWRSGLCKYKPQVEYYKGKTDTVSFGSAISVECLVKPDTSTHTGLIFKNNDRVPALGTSSVFSLGLVANVPYFGVNETASDSSGVASAVAAISKDSWTHLAGTYNGSTVRLYVNGVVADSASASGALGRVNDLWIGAYSPPFSGHLDEVRISSVVRTSFNKILDSVGVFILSHASAGVLGTGQLGDSAFSNWSAYQSVGGGN